MIDWNRATSLVTGASSGIGLSMAEELARRGSRLVLVSRDPERLARAAVQLTVSGNPEPVTIPLDLSRPGAARELAHAVDERGLAIDVLVNNAGHSLAGDFADQDPERLEAMLQLDVVANAMVLRAFLPGMLQRRSGIVVNVASVAAFHPFPTQAAYGAAKAFVLSLSESVWAETRGRGVRVLALCPGATDTGFFRTVGRPMDVPKATPESVAKAAFAALERDAMTTVPGVVDHLRSRVLATLLPRRVAARVVHGVMVRTYR